MKTIFVFITIITFGYSHAVEIQHLPNQKDEETNYDNLCENLNITINFSHLTLNRLNENFLSSPIITCLSLNNNEIESIDSNSFKNLPNLRYLDLSNNKFHLTDIFSDSYMNLETLILDNVATSYNLYHCDNRCFDSYRLEISNMYPKLKKLFIRETDNPFQIKATSKVNFPSLTHLYLSGSKVFSDEFDWLPISLEYLDLSGHQLTSLSLKNLKNLKLIFLGNPVEKSLSKINLVDLINLQYLSIPSNSINEITHFTFKNLNALLFLDLSDNDVQYIEGGSFDSMNNLQFLNLSNNNIELIRGGTFDKLSNLQMLALEKNLISMFPIITNEMKLQVISLNCNKLKSIIVGTFSKMPELETLYLHDNEISYIDYNAFNGLHNLKTLTLSNNMLSTLPYNWMSPLLNIENVDLSGNSFSNFGDLSLSDISPVKNLYLSNQVKYIKPSSLENVPENVTINLNPSDVFIEQCVKSKEKYSRRYG